MRTDDVHTGTGVSRRRFLGGSVAAAVGALSAGRVSSAQGGGAVDMSHLRPDGAIDEAFWRRIRREFNIVDEMTYLNTGTLGPMPRPVFDAQMRYTRELAEDPRGGNNARRTEAVRSRVAAFIGADPDEVVLTRSTTEGVKLFCAGLDLKDGDEVLMSTHEHPGGYGPWRAREQRHGIKVNTVQIPAPPESVDQIVSIVERAMTPRTRVLLVSHPIFVTGTLMPIKPLAEMAHRRDVLVSVDGAHALGMIELNMHEYGIDHYTTAGQKWLLAGTGTGVAYFRRDVLPKVWTDLIRENDDEQTARKFERSGQRHMPSQWAMGDAVAFQDAIGRQNIEARVHELAAYLREGLRDISRVTTVTSSSPELSGGLTTFYIEGVPSAVTRDVLLDRFGIFVAGSGFNPNACRVSTHLFVSRNDLDRLLEGVTYVAANAATLTSSAA